jgi:hypothetical protein
VAQTPVKELFKNRGSPDPIVRYVDFLREFNRRNVAPTRQHRSGLMVLDESAYANEAEITTLASANIFSHAVDHFGDIEDDEDDQDDEDVEDVPTALIVTSLETLLLRIVTHCAANVSLTLDLKVRCSRD